MSVYEITPLDILAQQKNPSLPKNTLLFKSDGQVKIINSPCLLSFLEDGIVDLFQRLQGEHIIGES